MEKINDQAAAPQPKPKRGFLGAFFMVIGIIAVIILLMVVGAIIALIIIKPYGLDVAKLPAAYLNMKSDQPSAYDHPLLTAEQEKFLESVNVDVKSLPAEITAEQEACGIQALGADRVNAIKAGAAPSLTDYLKAKDCF